MNLFNTLVTKPFGYLLLVIYNFVGSYGIAILLFSVVVQIILFPLSLRQQRTTIDTARIQPKIKELEKKYKGDREKINQAMMQLYKEENVNPAAGCLPILIQFPIIIGLFSVIRQPLSFMYNLTREQIVNIVNVLGLDISEKMISQSEIVIAEALKNNINLFPEFAAHNLINFKFLGINLASTPSLNNPAVIWIIPILSCITSYYSIKISMKANTAMATNPQAASMNKSMSVTMPLMSLWFTFMMPGGVGLYWIYSNLFNMLRQMLLYKIMPIPEPPQQTGKKKEKKDAKDNSSNRKNH